MITLSPCQLLIFFVKSLLIMTIRNKENTRRIWVFFNCVNYSRWLPMHNGGTLTNLTILTMQRRFTFVPIIHDSFVQIFDWKFLYILNLWVLNNWIWITQHILLLITIDYWGFFDFLLSSFNLEVITLKLHCWTVHYLFSWHLNNWILKV